MCSLGFVIGLVDDADAGSTSTKRIKKNLAKGEAAFQDQEYKKAIRTLRKVADNEGATTALRARSLEFIGLSFFILGKKKAAEETFFELVVLDPAYELTEDFDSEEIREAFASAKNEFLENGAPAKLTLQKLARAPAGKPLTIDVHVDDADQLIKSLVVHVRKRGETAYQTTQMGPIGDDRWRARVATNTSESGYAIEYYIEGLDIGGRPRTRLASPSTPRTLDIKSSRKQKWYRNWYVIAGGVVVVGLTTTIIVAATRD